MKVSRRNFLQFCGGATAGMVVSPLPWKLLDDVSIWTQNGTWIEETPRGPVTWRHATCTLCPRGCGLRLRRVNETTVSVFATVGHPLSGGGLCPLGLGAAQLRYHPARLRCAAVRNRGTDVAWRPIETEAALTEVGRKLASLRQANAIDRAAVLDLRPGRSLSRLYQEFLSAAGGGRYLVPSDGCRQVADSLHDLLDLPGLTPGIDLAQARTVLSFGVPLLDREVGAGRHSFELIQAQSCGSPTTERADVWLPIRPGSEAALALGLVHLLRQEPGGDRRGAWVNIAMDDNTRIELEEMVARFTPDRVAVATGLEPRTLRATMNTLKRSDAPIALGGGHPGCGPLGREEELAVWLLNLTLADPRSRNGGAFVLRPDDAAVFGEDAGPVRTLDSIVDGSLDLLIIDGAQPGSLLPRDLMRRKMRDQSSLIVALSAFAAGPAAEADLIIPVPAASEWMDDVPTGALAARASYALGEATEKMPRCFGPGAFDPPRHPAALLDRLAGVAGIAGFAGDGRARHEQILRDRLEALVDRRDGVVFDPESGETNPINRIGGPRKLRRILAAGGCWLGGPASAPAALSLAKDAGLKLAALGELATGRCSDAPAEVGTYPLVAMPAPADATAFGGVQPPVVNKLYRESNLRDAAGTARVNPATARGQGRKGGERCRLVTRYGATVVDLVLDESVMPGVVTVAIGPDPENLGDPALMIEEIQQVFGSARRPVWRIERAALREV